IPDPIKSGTLDLSDTNIRINTPGHGLESGFKIYFTKLCCNRIRLYRIYEILVIDENIIEINIESSTLPSSLDGIKIDYIVDNYNLEYNISMVNIYISENIHVSKNK